MPSSVTCARTACFSIGIARPRRKRVPRRSEARPRRRARVGDADDAAADGQSAPGAFSDVLRHHRRIRYGGHTEERNPWYPDRSAFRPPDYPNGSNVEGLFAAGFFLRHVWPAPRASLREPAYGFASSPLSKRHDAMDRAARGLLRVRVPRNDAGDAKQP